MKVVVCVRQDPGGELGAFDACAYEAALQLRDAEVTLLSMGTPAAEGFLLNLTRLGAEKAILLTDRAFAGADTLATAYALSNAVRKLSPDLVLCGRQTLVGDTAQTGPMLAQMLGWNLITNVMQISEVSDKITCKTRTLPAETTSFPAVLTVERINQLRLPSLRSRIGTVEIWDAAAVGADSARCGLTGSPTRVLETHENEVGKRKCTLLAADQLDFAVEQGLLRQRARTAPAVCEKQLEKVWTVGDAPYGFAETVSRDITVIREIDAAQLAEKIKCKKPNAVLFGSDDAAKKTAACVAAMLNLGLCADCTALETDGNELLMIRPALSGSVIAKIKSLTKPALATVRTAQTDTRDVFVAAGYGAKDAADAVQKLCDIYHAEPAASRKAVDHGAAPYEYQVGLTGKTVSPPVYIAVGISGAVHHIVGMQRAGTVIAINPDRTAPVFDYADYGIVATVEEVAKFFNA